MTDRTLATAEVIARDVFGKRIANTEISIEEKRGAGGKHYRAIVTAPGYYRDGVNLDFNGHGELTLFLDPEQCVGPSMEDAQAANLKRKMLNTLVAGNSIWNYVVTDPVVVHPDRAWYRCGEELADDLEFSLGFKRAAYKMHHAPKGKRWTKAKRSYKSLEPHLGIQLTFWNSGWRWYVEVDIDPNKGIRHLYDALLKHPLTGQPDPRFVAQLMVLYLGLPMGFEMKPRTT